MIGEMIAYTVVYQLCIVQLVAVGIMLGWDKLLNWGIALNLLLMIATVLGIYYK